MLPLKEKADYIGAFCVTAGFGTTELAQQYEDANDDYNAIMVKVADRLAEAMQNIYMSKCA